MWRNFLISPCDKYVGLQVPKNAGSSFNKCFKEIGWRQDPERDLNNIPKDAIIFAWLRDPRDRWVKGFTQFLTQVQDFKLLEERCLKHFVPGIYDNHTMPISMMYQPIFDRIQFIKLDENVITSTNEFLAGDYVIEHRHYNKAIPAQQSAYVRVAKLLEDARWRHPNRNFEALFEYDIEAWEKLCQKK